MSPREILEKLPYDKPFLFVDDILAVTADGITGTYKYDKNLDFYNGHFKNEPVTPGVILAETMAQIGVVCLGIYLLSNEPVEESSIALTSMEIDYLKPVFPGEKVTVISEKIYFRFGKLKCSVRMTNESGEEVSSGIIAGIICK
jgi:3-hydroxyacyl-[acyl-carrier-protein] dehydratase